MLKSVVAVIVSYIVMVIFLFAVFTAAYLALGPERAFQPGTYAVSPLWLAFYAVANLCAAILGGYLCAAISQSRITCRAFAGIVFALALLLCVPAMRADKTPRVRMSDIPNLQAMHQAQIPVWMHLLNPFICAVGVLFGSCRKRHAISIPPHS
ncbi:MAG TPA: hypothetical protein VK581_12955 [Chthoniobacterales bacterium]|nr:hypothetical protein [Chthoniobacterales bacterium]